MVETGETDQSTMSRTNPAQEASVLVLTTDLPYFPGKMGVDYFNLRHLAQHYRVGVVAPCYDYFPKEGVVNLEAFLSGSYFWPRPAVQVVAMLAEEPRARLRSWVARLPSRIRLWMFRRLLALEKRGPM